MNRYLVVMMPAAVAQSAAIDDWWRSNRDDPDLFLRELEAALEALETWPSALGSRYRRARRVLLRKTRYHVYYVVDDVRRLVEIRAVWHAVRGNGPVL